MPHLSIYSPSLSIYFFVVPLRCFYGCVLSATMCLISTFPPRTNRLSDAASSVKLYLSHAAVRFDEMKLERTHIFTGTPPTHTHTHTHTLSLFPAYPIPPFAAFSRKARELFFRDFIEIHLLTPKSLLLFNPTLSKDFKSHSSLQYNLLCCVCVRGKWREKCDSDVGSEWKPRE